MAATAAPVDLSNQEILRYSRHLLMAEVGIEGQRKLKAARVLCIGAGGLGSPLTLYLAAAGVGRLGLVDFDNVDLTNLHRQIIHGTSDIGRKKLDSAVATLSEVNPHVELVRHDVALSAANAMDIIRGYDIVVDGTDNFPTRYLVNDACVLLGKINVYGSVFRFEGQATVFGYPGGPCYRCLYPEPPPPGLVPSCADGGVLGILPGVVGLIQATETVKLIIGRGEPLVGRLLLYDALGMRFRELKLRRSPDCPLCGVPRTLTELIDYHQFCGVPRPDGASNGHAAVAPLVSATEIDPPGLKARFDRGEDFVLLDVREAHEYQICRIPGSTLIPMREIPYRLGELDPEDDIVVHCRTGVRSAKVCEFLRQNGFQTVRNLRGGILAWADQVDPTVPKY